jgi:hypothetical protein
MLPDITPMETAKVAGAEAAVGLTKARMSLIEQQVKWYAPIQKAHLALMNAQTGAAGRSGRGGGRGGGVAAAGLALRQAALKVGIVKASVDDLYNLQTMAQSYRLAALNPDNKVAAKGLNDAADIFDARAAMMEKQLQSMGQAGPQVQGQPGGTVSVNIGGAQYVIPTGTGLVQPARMVSKFTPNTETQLIEAAGAAKRAKVSKEKWIANIRRVHSNFSAKELGKVYEAAR